MSTKLAAIDFSPHHARIVIIESTLRRAELTATASVARHPDEERAEFWERVRAALPADVDSVVVDTDPSTTSSRVLNFPFGDARKVEAALEFELEGLVPYDIEDLATSWTVVDRTNDKCRVLTTITPRQRLQSWIDDLSDAGMEPRAIVPSAVGLGELLPRETLDTIAVASLGGSQSHVAVFKKGLRFVRTLQAGGFQVDRTLAKRFNVELPEAKQAKEHEAQVLPDDPEITDKATKDQLQISAAVVDGLSPLLTALITTFKSLPADDTPNRLILTGGLSRLPGIAEYLESQLGISVELLDLKGGLFPVECNVTVGPEFCRGYWVGVVLLASRSNHAVEFAAR